jgi:hypothetical protein
MKLDFMTPDVWNGLVIAVVLIGLAFAVLRLYNDFSRPPEKKDQSETDGQRRQGDSQDQRSGRQ